MEKRERGRKVEERERERENVSIMLLRNCYELRSCRREHRIHLHVTITARCYARLSAASLAVNAVSGTA